jgi:enoyl-CoA hydratase/carnithine racemase
VAAVVAPDPSHPEPLVAIGTPQDWEEVVASPEDVRALKRFPGATVAVVAKGDSKAPLLAAFDLVGTTTDLESWQAAFAAHPQAATILTRLVRDPGNTLEDESLAYSLLQAGTEFAAWLAERSGTVAGSDDSPRVALTNDGPIAEVVLTRPWRRNAFDARMREELCDALDVAAGADAIILRGDGPSFSSGGDLAEFGSLVGPVHAHLLRTFRSVPARLQRLGPRLVVGVQGPCVGAGVEFAAFAARVVAAQGTTFRLPEVGFGLIPGAGGTVSLPQRVGNRRFGDLALSGRRLDLATALSWGLVDEVVHATALQDRLKEVAATLAGS